MLDLPSPGERSPGDVFIPLLLAVFVIVVTAFLATVVLDMGQEPGNGDVAGVTVEFDPGADRIRVAFTSMTRPGTTLHVSVEDASQDETIASATLAGVGHDHVFDQLEDGREYRVVVVADWDGGRSVVTSRSGRL